MKPLDYRQLREYVNMKTTLILIFHEYLPTFTRECQYFSKQNPMMRLINPSYWRL